jgi:uncharacterized protein involved in type VI secretion and phage assembly
MQTDALDALMTWVKTHYFGKYAGKVVENKDPLAKGRLKVEVPDVYGVGVGVWALPCVPYAGADVGFKSFPEAGANVWVEFEKGDISYPVWVGFFWGDGDMPAEAGDDGNIKLWKTGSILIEIDDENQAIRITSTNGAMLTLSADIAHEVGNVSLIIDSSSVTADAGGKLEVAAMSVTVNSGALVVS